MTRKASPQHRRSIRLRGYDYSQPGAYFVTLCTQNHRPLFGRIVRGEMELSSYGRIVEDEWARTGALRPYVRLGALAVMPNHVHAIIWIVSPDVGPGETVENGPVTGTTHSLTGTACRARTSERFGKPVPHSLPTIVRAFKAAVTKRVNGRRGTPGAPVWHRNYYEHVVRDESDLARLRTYIAENPGRWVLLIRLGGSCIRAVRHWGARHAVPVRERPTSGRAKRLHVRNDVPRLGKRRPPLDKGTTCTLATARRARTGRDPAMTRAHEAELQGSGSGGIMGAKV